MTDPPHDRPIEVLTREEGVWVRVRWRGERYVVEGEDAWVLPEEVEDWREVPHPAIGGGVAAGVTVRPTSAATLRRSCCTCPDPWALAAAGSRRSRPTEDQ